MLKKTVSGIMIALFLLSVLTIISVRANSKTVDLNGDGIVDGEDIILAAKAFGSYPEHPRWNSDADINGDELVNFADIVLIARNFGETFP